MNYYTMLFTNLLSLCPIDTGNMVSNITLVEFDTYYLISILAPKGDYDYARAVNYGLSAKYQKRPMSPKEQKNFEWVERAIKLTNELWEETHGF